VYIRRWPTHSLNGSSVTVNVNRWCDVA